MRLGVLTIPALLAACSGSTEPYTSDADLGSTHALVTIERRDSASNEGNVQTGAFASFVRTPPDVDPSMVARITGLVTDLPEVGECALSGSGRDSSVPLSPMRRIELLPAGEVTLESPDGRVELAPRAFPGVTDLVAGVVYTTRDRAAALPPASVYAVSVEGSPTLPPLAVSAEAPLPLVGVTVGGLPLTEGVSLDAAGAELTWVPGSSRDLVYVAVARADATRHSLCTFRDEVGRGTLPSAMLPSAGPAAISVHRLRSISLAGATSAVDAGELRFDFERSAPVEISAR